MIVQKFSADQREMLKRPTGSLTIYFGPLILPIPWDIASEYYLHHIIFFVHGIQSGVNALAACRAYKRANENDVC